MTKLKLKHRLRAMFLPSESRAYKEREHLKKQMRAGQLFVEVTAGHCDRCSTQSGFYDGPSGGALRNLFCRNDDCRANYNVTDLGNGTGWAELVGRAEAATYERARQGAFSPLK